MHVEVVYLVKCTCLEVLCEFCFSVLTTQIFRRIEIVFKICLICLGHNKLIYCQVCSVFLSLRKYSEIVILKMYSANFSLFVFIGKSQPTEHYLKKSTISMHSFLSCDVHQALNIRCYPCDVFLATLLRGYTQYKCYTQKMNHSEVNPFFEKFHRCWENHRAASDERERPNHRPIIILSL